MSIIPTIIGSVGIYISKAKLGANSCNGTDKGTRNRISKINLSSAKNANNTINNKNGTNEK